MLRMPGKLTAHQEYRRPADVEAPLAETRSGVFWTEREQKRLTAYGGWALR